MGSKASKYDSSLLPVGKEGFMKNFNGLDHSFLHFFLLFSFVFSSCCLWFSLFTVDISMFASWMYVVLFAHSHA